jgi:uncharacterized repeat protein (TIGR03943 family)
VSRETENVLLLVGLCTAMIVVTGSYTRYVKPSLLPWLVATAVLLIALAMCAIVRDIQAHGPRRQDDDHEDHHDEAGHAHRPAVVWLLVLPIALMAFVVPPALGARAVEPTVTEVSRKVLYRPFPPLPAGRAPELPLQEVVSRADLDSTNALDGLLITVTGFTLKESDGIDLGRVVIICCAADARLARVHLRGPAAAKAAVHAEETWLSVEGTVVPEPPDEYGTLVPTLTVSAVTPIPAPKNSYSY